MAICQNAFTADTVMKLLRKQLAKQRLKINEIELAMILAPRSTDGIRYVPKNYGVSITGLAKNVVPLQAALSREPENLE